MIFQQCFSCVEKGKNVYCNNCVKSGDYYDIYKYAGGVVSLEQAYEAARLTGFSVFHILKREGC